MDRGGALVAGDVVVDEVDLVVVDVRVTVGLLGAKFPGAQFRAHAGC